ncbi:MAG: outer membrane protein assembly factor BamA [Candidatus Eiseniibacteriota bacterium]|nr:MAG: outer membrane protein assembly factor BamA [Candidatus Eisenbacteria bacterium]
MMKTLMAFLAAVLFLSAALGCEEASCQDVPVTPPATPPVTPVIQEIRLSGLEQVDSSVVLNSFGLEPGDPFSFEKVREGVSNLYALGYFADVGTEAEEVEGGVILKLVLTENPRVVGIRFEGIKGIDEKTLKEKLTLKEYDFFTERLIFAQKKAIVAAYREEGYPLAVVEGVRTRERDRGRVEVTFEVSEGHKVKVKAIEFEGNVSVEGSKLRKVMDTKVKSWWRGGKFRQETLEEDLQKVVKYYQSQGFRDATVKDQQLTYSEDKKDLFISVTVQEGPLYYMGNTEWKGNRVLGTEELTRLIAYKKGEHYDIEKIEKTLTEVYSLYAEHGYIFVAVDREENLADDGAVDLSFSIEEGEPSQVRHVRVSGNERTKEKVIRRELLVKPGQLFKRSTLMRSQRDVFALGFFEDVLIDYQVNDPPDIDLIFKVKEKQTGTATAGAGFTSDAGLTGFVELGHNNLFGNGQSIMLHVERGSRRSNLDLSFTEPWFMDTPTSVGVDLFSTDRRRDVYDDVRRGGGIRVGRPLPWIDYTRLYVSYTLQDVTLKNFSAGYEGGLDEVDWPQRTSTIETAFVRNSTDSPFYPSRGSRLSVNSEFSGGVLGGDQSFHKHVVDFRWYRKAFWRTAVMTRLRVGAMDAYNHYERVPQYERFRLGGTTVDFLRGYPDYDIVPDSNLRWEDGYLIRWPGGRLMSVLTLEYQFPIADPLRGLFFLDIGDTWNRETEIDLSGFKKGAGFGLRLEIPMLGQVGFDYAYGFDRVDGAKWEPHFIMGRLF